MTTLINGIPCDTISVDDRGLLYGDGVFRTMLWRNGKLQQWPRHYAKLRKDCLTLNLPCPAEALLRQELDHITRNAQDGIVKILVTRGRSQRGYAPAPYPVVTRILSLNPLPVYPDAYSKSGVRLHLCQLRLAHQPKLAGAKHLNRLENVLAAAEWDSPEIAEGLLLDQSDNVIEGARSNLFMVKDGELLTPDLSRCGVAGVTRERLIEHAAVLGLRCRITNISLPELQQADEIFLVNSVIGLWPVREMPGYFCEQHSVAHVIQDWLLNENN